MYNLFRFKELLSEEFSAIKEADFFSIWFDFVLEIASFDVNNAVWKGISVLFFAIFLYHIYKSRECGYSTTHDKIIFIFYSNNFIFVSGKSMAKGIPGKPPPVPTSKTLDPGLNCMTLAIARECNT